MSGVQVPPPLPPPYPHHSEWSLPRVESDFDATIPAWPRRHETELPYLIIYKCPLGTADFSRRDLGNQSPWKTKEIIDREAFIYEHGAIHRFWFPAHSRQASDLRAAFHSWPCCLRTDSRQLFISSQSLQLHFFIFEYSNSKSGSDFSSLVLFGHRRPLIFFR